MIVMICMTIYIYSFLINKSRMLIFIAISRNCPCCKGFKYGCNCCKSAGVNTCRDPNCMNLNYVASGEKVLPIGATPSQNGVLSPYAAEFWCPERLKLISAYLLFQSFLLTSSSNTTLIVLNRSFKYNRID